MAAHCSKAVVQDIALFEVEVGSRATAGTLAEVARTGIVAVARLAVDTG